MARRARAVVWVVVLTAVAVGAALVLDARRPPLIEPASFARTTDV